MALKHASNEYLSSGLVEGVEITLEGLRKALEKFGLTGIEAEGKTFVLSIHHAISQVSVKTLTKISLWRSYERDTC